MKEAVVGLTSQSARRSCFLIKLSVGVDHLMQEHCVHTILHLPEWYCKYGEYV